MLNRLWLVFAGGGSAPMPTAQPFRTSRSETIADADARGMTLAAESANVDTMRGEAIMVPINERRKDLPS